MRDKELKVVDTVSAERVEGPAGFLSIPPLLGNPFALLHIPHIEPTHINPRSTPQFEGGNGFDSAHEAISVGFCKGLSICLMAQAPRAIDCSVHAAILQ
jgi:hypothetical protein